MDLNDPQSAPLEQAPPAPDPQPDGGRLAAQPSSAQYVPIIDDMGQMIQIRADQAQQAVQNSGFRMPTADEAERHRLTQEYGEGHGLEAAAEGAARGLSFGLSDVALTHLGVSKGRLNTLKEEYPLSSGGGELGAIGAGLLTGQTEARAGAGLWRLLATPVREAAATGKAVTSGVGKVTEKLASSLVSKEASPLAHKLLSQDLALASGAATEGAIYGAGQSVGEYALGDPDKASENILHNIGYGALYGGAIAGALGADASKLGAASSEVKEAALRDSAADASKLSTPGPIGSFDDLNARLKNAPFQGMGEELPARQLLLDSESKLPDLQFPVTNLQVEAMGSRKASDFYKTLREQPSEQGDMIRRLESAQKYERHQVLQKEIRSLAPDGMKDIAPNEMAAGSGMIEDFTKSYDAEKKALAPAFEKIDQAGIIPAENPKGIIDAVNTAIPGAQDFISMRGPNFKLEPYNATMPFSRAAYGSIRDVVSAANKKGLTLGDLRNVRDSMRDRVNWLSAPREAQQISSLRKSMLDYIQDNAQKVIPDVEVREAMQKYAINEGKREQIEKLFGGSISDKATFAKEIKPENVLSKVFSNTATVDAAKALLGQQGFDKALANYLYHEAVGVTDAAKNGFSSQKFATFLRNKGPELQVAMAEKGDKLARIHALTDTMRILPDAPSINPSGTAKTLKMWDTVHKIGSLLTSPAEGVKELGEKLKQVAEMGEGAHSKAIAQEILKGSSFEEAEKIANTRIAHYGMMKRIQELGEKTSEKISRGAKSVFSGPDQTEALSGLVGSKLTPKDKEKAHAKIGLTAQNHVDNPEAMMQALQDATGPLHAAAPQIASSLSSSLVKATTFLASKYPKGESKLLSPKWEPSPAETAKFDRYYQTIQNPIGVLKEVKQGTLVPEHLETLQVVYPKLYQEMQQALAGHLSTHLSKKQKEMPYQTKMMLSAFLGSDLVNSLAQQSVAANQSTMMKIDLEQQAQDQAMNGGVRPTQKGMANLSKSARIKTNMQSVAERADT